MPKYGDPLYGTSTYGAAAVLEFSVEPLTATAVDYQKVNLDWSNPSGNFSRIRLVRNENAYPETADDGITLWEEEATQGTVSRNTFVDNGTPVALVGGRYVYYRMFLRVNGIWRVAGSTNVLLPRDHYSHMRLDNPSDPTNPYVDVPTDSGTARKIVSLLPEVFFRNDSAATDTTFEDSDLTRFLAGIALTVDEFLTHAELLTPSRGGRLAPPQLLRVMFSHMGIGIEPSLPFKNQKRMLREALYYYTHRGTTLGLTTWLEALTGFSTEVTISPNLMLDVRDSSFKEGIGHWQATAATLVADNSQSVADEPLAIETAWVGKVTANEAGATIAIGTDVPVHHGVPVQAGTDYAFAAYLRGAGDVSAVTTWYDYRGEELASSPSAALSTTASWQKLTLQATAPEGAAYASLTLTFAAVGDYYVDMCSFVAGDGSGDFEDARVVKVFFSPLRTNYVSNPSFEVDLTGWTANGATVAQDGENVVDLYAGENSCKVEATDVWDLTYEAVPGLRLGRTYTASAYVAAATTTDLTLTVDAARDGVSMASSTSTVEAATQVVGITYKHLSSNLASMATDEPHGFTLGQMVTITGVDDTFDGDHVITQVLTNSTFSFALTGEDVPLTATAGTATLTGRSAWVRVQTSVYVADDGGAPVDVTLSLSGDAGTVWVDAVQLEDSITATDYFDGSMPPDLGIVWRGGPDNAHAAYSDYYPNLGIKMARAADALPEGIVRNQMWSISTTRGIEAAA